MSAEGLGTVLEALFALFIGVIIGLIYNWKVSITCMICTPFMILGGVMNIKFQSGLSSNESSAAKEADLLAGDAILNYRTVASFANEDKIV